MEHEHTSLRISRMYTRQCRTEDFPVLHGSMGVKMMRDVNPDGKASQTHGTKVEARNENHSTVITQAKYFQGDMLLLPACLA